MHPFERVSPVRDSNPVDTRCSSAQMEQDSEITVACWSCAGGQRARLGFKHAISLLFMKNSYAEHPSSAAPRDHVLDCYICQP